MSGPLRPWVLILARSPGARTYAGAGASPRTQGQSPEPRTREYFYYVDHQGQVGGGVGLYSKATRPPRSR